MIGSAVDSYRIAPQEQPPLKGIFIVSLISDFVSDLRRMKRGTQDNFPSNASIDYCSLGPRNKPPLTSSVCPVIQRASSEAKKATTSPMSTGRPGRRSAVMAATRSIASTSLSRIEGFMSVSVPPIINKGRKDVDDYG